MHRSEIRHPINISGQRPTWAEIDLEALAANFQLIKRKVGPAIQVMAVVKANAYGHGAVPCARRLAAEGADWFAVALPEEGIELREAGISQPILCLGGLWEGQAAACIQHRLTPVVYRFDMIEALDRAARDAGVIADVHLKIDTGMGRLGIRFDELDETPAALRRFANLRLDGLMTHFAAADDPTCEALTEDQVARFASAATVFRQAGHELRFLHSANSAGIYSHPDAWGNMIRPGGVLYGLWRDVLPVDSRGGATKTSDVASFANCLPEVGTAGRNDWLWMHFRSFTENTCGDDSDRVRRWLSAAALQSFACLSARLFRLSGWPHLDGFNTC